MATLQQQVQQHLQNTGISLRELARRSGISHQAIGNILRDTDLECAKYRRVMQLEQQLNDANTAYLSSKSQHERDLQRLNDANAEIKRLTALSQTHGQSWKAACVQVEQLQKQLDHGQAQSKSLQAAYDQQVDDEREMLAQIDTLFVERENAETLHDQQIMRLRVYVWSLIAALVFVLVSCLVVWGGV